ncbi:hypothetical protein CRG98_017279 [Punica granatum]|uniref:Uncharacterized protein n=1 Tax=Punica granatum TaxID=22663 RepID=A0A2I0K144_PUNGR|nr:hypothetical protein CRG98_017279 [Punica granatum]
MKSRQRLNPSRKKVVQQELVKEVLPPPGPTTNMVKDTVHWDDLMQESTLTALSDRESNELIVELLKDEVELLESPHPAGKVMRQKTCYSRCTLRQKGQKPKVNGHPIGGHPTASDLTEGDGNQTQNRRTKCESAKSTVTILQLSLLQESGTMISNLILNKIGWSSPTETTNERELSSFLHSNDFIKGDPPDLLAIGDFFRPLLKLLTRLKMEAPIMEKAP